MARDMRVRWALAEVGPPYDVRPVSFSQMRDPAYRARRCRRAERCAAMLRLRNGRWRIASIRAVTG